MCPVGIWALAPSVSDFTDDGSLLLPTSDANMGAVDEIGDEVEEIGEWLGSKRKRANEANEEVTARWKVARREGREMLPDDESGVETDDERKPSRSASASRRLKELARSADFMVDEKKRKRFEEKCVEMDSEAKFRYQDAGWQVLHSKCLKWYKMSEPYNATKFRQHLGTCKARGDKQNLLITSFFKPKDPNDGTEAKSKITVSARNQIFVGGSASASPSIKPPQAGNELVAQRQPCLGISKRHDPLVSTYLSRTVVEGAGSVSLQEATEMVFGKGAEYSKLTGKQKADVTTAQSHLRSWSINRELQVIFSTVCAKFVDQDRSPNKTCSNCEKVLRSDSFKRALRVKPAPFERMKFIPAKYRGSLEDLGAKFAGIRGLSDLLQDDPQTSMWVRFVRGVIKGEYDDKLVFLAMIQATVTAHDRNSRGVGLQNMIYLPIYEEFTQMVALTSPRTYRLLAPHIQLPSLRHHQSLRSRSPLFPRFICNDSFLLAQHYMASVGYSGPTAATKAVLVANPEELQNLLARLEDKVATKLRLWCIQIPLIGIPSMIVAAEAIPNNLTAEELYEKSREVIDNLKSHGINAVSYSSDGTKVERAVQDLLISHAMNWVTHTIPDPEDDCTHEIRIPMYRLSPIVMIQDSKHAAKTMRNNLFSGARALVLGNHLAMYSHVRDMAFNPLPGCPLYHRDVEKLDRQDDNSATRLFSAAVLDFAVNRFPDRLGLIVYLFVMGEVVDAYQSWTITHLERIKMVLRCRYLLRLWKCFLNAARYPKTRYYISREADDILDTLVDGLIGLVYVYRDHLGEQRYPLLPWLHSTEICEHVFAECRKLVKDFTHLDFLHMVPRLHIMIRAASLFSKGTDPKARAMGYSHSYLNPENAHIALVVTRDLHKKCGKGAIL
ncbi:hypothetical protein BJ322DRAFT_1112246 [Thelephora terrestris]|uniref:Uncharacterized protein n=1 Tax=Thelephora terrestris TaxID=56493 RepID=A0A9P6H7E5_9AGAM|nr:hypothetical protein BJ322DRAFT_1112246 [Thelephora terrestris]